MNAEVAQEQSLLAAAYRRYLAANVLFHLAAAETAGLTPVDYQASNLLELDGPLSNGQLAARLGLTSGATTRLVDRLEARGLARRTVDPDDRRRAVIAHTGELPAELVALLDAVRAPIGRAVDGLSPEQVDGLRTYLAAATDAFLAAASDTAPTGRR